MGVGKDGYEVYGSNLVGIDLTDPEVVQHITPKMARKWGISKDQLNNIRKILRKYN